MRVVASFSVADSGIQKFIDANHAAMAQLNATAAGGVLPREYWWPMIKRAWKQPRKLLRYLRMPKSVSILLFDMRSSIHLRSIPTSGVVVYGDSTGKPTAARVVHSTLRHEMAHLDSGVYYVCVWNCADLDVLGALLSTILVHQHAQQQPPPPLTSVVVCPTSASDESSRVSALSCK